MYEYERHVTHIPSQVVSLPPPLLTPSISWTAVQSSPDRTSVLLRGPHECHIIRFSSSNASTSQHTRFVLPQPHRRLTASCWLSTGATVTEDIVQPAHRTTPTTTHASRALEAVVALGDDASAVSVLRASPTNATDRTATTNSVVPGTTDWTQATMFLHDERFRLFASGAALSNAQAGLPSYTPAWKAVETILPCQYSASSSTSGHNRATAATSAATDMYLVCQRRDDVRYRGDGAADVRAGTTCHGVWMASVAKETAWMVPLTMPNDNDDDEVCKTIDGTTVSPEFQNGDISNNSIWRHGGRAEEPSVAGLNGSRCDGHVRLFDVRHRLSTVCGSAATGLVFAAASRQHVGLFAAATVTPTVFFALPKQDSSPPSSSAKGRWVVTSVLEAPSPELAALRFSPFTSQLSAAVTNQHTFLVTRSRAALAQCTQYADVCNEQWWLMYDVRQPSMPVWSATSPMQASAPECDTMPLSSCEENRHDPRGINTEGKEASEWDEPRDDVIEWLCSTTQTQGRGAGPRVCASYQPSSRSWLSQERKIAERSAGPLRSSGRLHVLLDGTAANNPATTAEEVMHLEQRKRSRTGESNSQLPQPLLDTLHSTDDQPAAPVLLTLSPPPSLAALGETQRVRALSYNSGVLTYLCSS